MEYAITQGGNQIGVAEVELQGLYYRIQCRCRFQQEGFHRVMLSDGSRQLDLGICVPVNGEFLLEKRIPKREIGEGTRSFFIQQEQETTRKRFVSVRPEQPFLHLQHLETAVFAEENGEVGLILND